VDECGNIWDCTLIIYGRHPYAHFNIGGGFKLMVVARRLFEGGHIMVGASVVGANDTLYFRVVH